MKNKAMSASYTRNRSDGPLPAIHVKPAAGNPRRGWLTAGPLTIPLALGRDGILANKREGDGGTPRGSFRPRQLWWRADRHPRPKTFLPVRTIRPNDAWCENPSSRHYNRAVRLEADQEGDRLTRADHLYDLLVVIGFNDDPVVRGKGSAIFLHVARPNYGPTEGCVAIAMTDWHELLPRLAPGDTITIRA